jgi:hypothetical protein
MQSECALPAGANSAALLGCVIGEAALAGADKLTLLLPPRLAGFGAWAEQMVAESLGKDGTGVVPIDGEPVSAPVSYGRDRLFVALGEQPGLDELRRSGFNVVTLPAPGREALGAELYRWEFATAVAGWVLGVNPFDQPNVQEAKDRTSAILAGDAPDVATPAPGDVLATVRAGDYIAIAAFLHQEEAVADQLSRLRLRLRGRYGAAVTVGFGPRLLHSTGQLHKAGPPSCVYIQVVDDDAFDVAIPGRSYSFGRLLRAQADGDLAALKARGRRVARVTLARALALA